MICNITKIRIRLSICTSSEVVLSSMCSLTLIKTVACPQEIKKITTNKSMYTHKKNIVSYRPVHTCEMCCMCAIFHINNISQNLFFSERD